MKEMNKAQVSLFVFGLYMIFGPGLGFMLMPGLVLDLFGLSYGDDVWIRFVGMLASILGAYYILVIRNELTRFYFWTVPARYYAATFMIVIFALGKLEAGILLFAAIDIGGATWTWLAIRSEKQ